MGLYPLRFFSSLHVSYLQAKYGAKSGESPATLPSTALSNDVKNKITVLFCLHFAIGAPYHKTDGCIFDKKENKRDMRTKLIDYTSNTNSFLKSTKN